MIKSLGKIKKKYLSIKNARHTLTNNELNIFCYILKNNNNYVSLSDAKKRYNYIKSIYNNNSILQDNVSYLSFLKELEKYDYDTTINLRMYKILDIFNLHDVNFENINESKKLINDYNNIILNSTL